MGKMGKLVIAVIILMIMFYIILTIGAILILRDEPDIGDGYFAIYSGTVLVILIITLVLQLLKSSEIPPANAFIQIVTSVFILFTAGCGLILTACLALNKAKGDASYVIVAVICALIIVGLLIAIRFMNRKPQKLNKQVVSLYE